MAQAIDEGAAPAASEATPAVSARKHKWSLLLFYTSHFLFTWNDRVWEFASVILLIAAYPMTLLPSSVFGLSSTASAIVFGPSVGRWFDSTPRLRSVRFAIFLQRIGVAAGCVCLWVMISHSLRKELKNSLFAVVILLGCIARLAFVGKTAGIERDWAVVISRSQNIDLNNMNATMRRIDLFCKLAGPLFVSFLTIPSPSFAALFLAGSNIASLPFEYCFILIVYRRFPSLADKPAAMESETHTPIRRILQWPQRTLTSWQTYYRSPLFAASVSLCILYFTVLSFGGSMIAFLSQYSGFSTPLIAGLRAIAVILGITATFLSPRVIRWIGPIRSGIWFLSWQSIFLFPVAVLIFLPLNEKLQGGLLVGFVSISRLGLWGFDLSEQYLVQQEVDAGIRGEFSTTEAALQSLFDVLQYTSTIIFSKPQMFKFPVLLSCVSVGVALCVYASFVRKQRGHLVHFYEKLLDRDGGSRSG